MSDVDLMCRFMLQLLLVLLVCRGLGWLGNRFLGQTQVVMEMVAGVLLGPSVLAILSPKAEAWLFPPKSAGASMSVLYVIAQLGLVFYMFMVGLDFNIDLIRHRAKGAISVSLAGIIMPFILGAGLSLVVGNRYEFFANGISPESQALYMGAAMCITAFPMLARIIIERGIAGTTMGTLALGAGATDDAAAWSILAIVLAFSKGSYTYAIYAIGGGLAFGALMIGFGRPIFAKLAKVVEREDGMSMNLFLLVVTILYMAAYYTDAIGIYAVFGAFITGVSMPRGRFATELKAKLEPLTVGVLLPFFFVYSGLNANIGRLDSAELWMVTGLVSVLAIAGKGLACTFATRASGENWRDSWAIGTLMNSRGLMELIIINIGLAQGVITQRLYTILVLMAILTTMMASPIFVAIYRKVGLPLDETLPESEREPKLAALQGG